MTIFSKQTSAFITQPGDLIQLNEHRLICGDSTDRETVERVLQNETPHLMVTEPPFENNYSSFWKAKIPTWEFPNNEFLKEVWKWFPGDICYVWHSSLEASKVEKSLRDFNFECLYQIVWAKNSYELSKGDYHWKHDVCWYAVKKGKSHRWRGSDLEMTLWLPDNQRNEDMVTIHPAQQNLECMARPIQHHTIRGDFVYEPFCGSGSTLIACEQLERRCLAIELSPKYCDEVVKRWIHFRKQSGQSHCVQRNGLFTHEYY